MRPRPPTRAVALLATVGLLASAIVPLPALAVGPVAWSATAGTATTDQAIQANAFLPGQLTVDAGDSVTWTVRSGEFHTVTFLSGSPAPPLIIGGPGGPTFNPAAVAPSGGPTYDGTGIASSGLLVEGQQYTLGFTAPGDYQFHCLIHAKMQGTLHVRPTGTAYPHSQAQYDLGAKVGGLLLTAKGRMLQGRTLAQANAAGRGTIAAGNGALFATSSLAVLRFLPGRTVIHAGQSVTWTNLDPEFPHTVTFGAEPPGGPFGAFAPSGAAVGGHATLTSPSDAANSGFLGAGLPFGTGFSATFTKPGTYKYICVLHDDLGMTGTIVVLP